MIVYKNYDLWIYELTLFLELRGRLACLDEIDREVKSSMEVNENVLKQLTY